MILSEKITELRKKSGLSQEQLGEQIGVSRQAVSKWEMAQSVPDINKIIALANYFGVSTDLLLRDDLDLAPPNDSPMPSRGSGPDSDTDAAALSADPGRRVVSMEEANEYLDARRSLAKRIVAAVILFFVSPFAGIILSSVSKDERIGIIGAIIQVVILAAAAVTVVMTVNEMKPFRYMKAPGAELAYGVRGAVESRRAAFEHYHLLLVIIGTALLICSVIPMMVCAVFTSTNAAAVVLCGLLMLLMLAAGISCILYARLIYRGFSRVLELG